MSKPLQDWTLKELQEYCDKTKNCDDCIFDMLCDLEPHTWDFKPQYSETDITIMRGLVAMGFPWVASDENGKIYAYENTPLKRGKHFCTASKYIGLLQDTLPQITWENSPVYLPDVLKEVDK